MHRLFQLDGAHLLVPTVALGEIILRGSLVDLLIFALMRVPLKREAGLTHFAPIWVNAPTLQPRHACTADNSTLCQQTGVFCLCCEGVLTLDRLPDFCPGSRLHRTEWQSATTFVRSRRWVKTRPWLLPCVHWSTLSACISTADGIVTPSCLAMVRLITSSSFMGRSTGRSPAGTPLRILATCRASWRAISTSLAP
jgi:hypothetical protein